MTNYTPDALISKGSAYGNPPIGAGQKLLSAIGSNIQTVDATGTPVTSPVSVASTSQTLTVPPKALSIILSAATAFDVSDDANHVAYFTVPANTIFAFDCFRMSHVYLHTGSTISISFAFKMLN